MKFYLGTTNKYKVQELAAILRPLDIDLEVTDPIDPEETGSTFKENAIIKATEYGKHIGNKLSSQLMLNQPSSSKLDSERICSVNEARKLIKLNRTYVISEDSGISIPALKGLPGPWSARFDDCVLENGKIVSHNSSDRSREEIDAANNKRVMWLMEGVSQPHRAASFGICLAVSDTDGNVVFTATNEVTGWIVESPKGTRGFGYDCIFASGSSFGKTWAEIDSMRKNVISHRRRVLQEFTAWLAAQLTMENR